MSRTSSSTMDSLVSAKRTANERRGIHKWHPYYAGYAEAFVEGAMTALECTPEMVVLDPWAGSGTTCVVASRAGLASVGVDINPVMAAFTAAKSPTVLGATDTLLSILRRLSYRRVGISNDDPLLSRFCSDTASVVRSIWNQLDASVPAVHGDGAINSEHAFLQSVVFVALRELAAPLKLSNPTWIGNHKGDIKVDANALQQGLSNCAMRMLKDLEQLYSSSDFPREIYSYNSAVASMPIVCGTIDRVVTSPPYLTRIDYAVSTSPELTLLGDLKFVHDIRHATTGAPVITSRPKDQRLEWGALCNLVLDKVKSHDSKAALSYYWKNMVQYFSDIEEALCEIFRVLKSGGSGLIVVQSSYFKEVEIPLGEIYVEMAERIGFTASIAYRDIVRSHMAHVNSRSNQYFPNKIFFEDTVLVRKQ